MILNIFSANRQTSTTQLSWSHTDKSRLLGLQNASSIAYLGTKESEPGAKIRTSEGMSDVIQCFYFEVKVIDCGTSGRIGIGLTPRSTDEDKDLESQIMPGWYPNTIAYHGDDGKIYKSGKDIEAVDKFTTNDTVSCQVKRVQVDESNFYILVQFGKNGTSVGSPWYVVNTELYPTVGLNSPGSRIETNLGEKAFAYQMKGTITKKYYW